MKILVVDDSKTSRVVLETFLKKEGHEVTSATNGMDALQMLREYKTFHLIFLDMYMPEMDGLGFLMALRNERIVGPYIIFLTAEKDQDKINKLLYLGKEVRLIDYILKPYSKEIILEKVKMVIQKKGDDSVCSQDALNKMKNITSFKR
ncbi:MAG: response regulator [Oligoflexia bacterium]|nr:response regulator [Oligoflexia bacterium]